MEYEKLHFKSKKQFRLPGFDYSSDGYYFITICVHDREKLFSNVVGKDPCVCTIDNISTGKNHDVSNVGTDPRVRSININKIGLMIQKWWLKIPLKFLDVKLDEFCIMPDHFHGIIVIQKPQTHGSVPTLGTIIQWFKSMTKNEYLKNIKINNWPKLNHHLWQPRFHDHIIRNEKEYFAIKQYIKNNPENYC